MYATSANAFSVLLNSAGVITLGTVDISALKIKYKRHFETIETTIPFLGCFVSASKYYILSLGKTFNTHLGTTTITIDSTYNHGIIFSSD